MATPPSSNFCEFRKRQNQNLRLVECCTKCHASRDLAEKESGIELEDEKWTCCELFNFEHVYRPSGRQINPLTS